MLGASFFSSRLVFVSMARMFVAKFIGAFFRQSGINKICAFLKLNKFKWQFDKELLQIRVKDDLYDYGPKFTINIYKKDGYYILNN